jgi:hypothetical protein
VRGAGFRALLGRPFRSPPSPEVRHKRGVECDDSGEWTEVRNRLRKALREGLRSVDRLQQACDHRFYAAIPKLSGMDSIDHHLAFTNRIATDHNLVRSHQSRYSRNISSD